MNPSQVILAAALFLAVSPLAWQPVSRADEVPDAKDLSLNQKDVERLRGRTFTKSVPTSTISAKELRELVDRDFAKEFPGDKLARYQELMVWQGLMPAGTDLKGCMSTFLEEQMAGLYNPETKRMYLPDAELAKAREAKEKENPKTQTGSGGVGMSVVALAHEYIHALDDQAYDLEAMTKDKPGVPENSDHSAAATFLTEGSATYLMVKDLPLMLGRASPEMRDWSLPIWQLLQWDPVEAALDLALSDAWKGNDIKVDAVPDSLIREMVIPDSAGYSFCHRQVGEWGLDGLDYAFAHPPASSEQVLHPGKSWEWRDFPVQVSLPKTLPGGWNLLTDDTIGEAGMQIWAGCLLKWFDPATAQDPDGCCRGWGGDRIALYGNPGGQRLMIWATTWDSAGAASRFCKLYEKIQKTAFQATVTHADGQVEWRRPDGRSGRLIRQGNRLTVIESNLPEALTAASDLAKQATFTESPELAVRAAANNAVLRYNPLVSWRRDADYSVTESLWGLLWRHDHNAIGAADSLLCGYALSCSRTGSYSKWSLLWDIAAKHRSDDRSRTASTSILPWGILWTNVAMPLPDDAAATLRRDSALWGLGFSWNRWPGGHEFRLLPGGLLLCCDDTPKHSSFHMLCTGVSSTQAGSAAVPKTKHQIRLLGLRIWSWNS